MPIHRNLLLTFSCIAVVALVPLACTEESSPTEPEASSLAGLDSTGTPQVAGATIDIEKSTNGEDADEAPGPGIQVGDPVSWEYVVTNVGDIPLTGVEVTDDQGVTVVCTQDSLNPGASMTCTASGTAVGGQYANIGTATGTATSIPDEDGEPASHSDPSHYFGLEDGTDGQGCSHGYWKNHLDSWVPTGYSPDDLVDSVFVEAVAFPALGSSTLLEALRFGGGPEAEGGAMILLRQAVAALLNAAHPDVGFPRTVAEVISSVDAALATGNRQTMLALKDELDAENNLGCTLN